MKISNVPPKKHVNQIWQTNYGDVEKHLYNIKMEIVKTFPNKKKAEKIIRQIEKSKSKTIKPSTYSVGEFFANFETNKLYLIDISFEWKAIEERDWLPIETHYYLKLEVLL